MDKINIAMLSVHTVVAALLFGIELYIVAIVPILFVGMHTSFYLIDLVESD